MTPQRFAGECVYSVLYLNHRLMTAPTPSHQYPLFSPPLPTPSYAAISIFASVRADRNGANFWLHLMSFFAFLPFPLLFSSALFGEDSRNLEMLVAEIPSIGVKA